MRVCFNLLMGNQTIYQSYPIHYFRIVGGKIIFQDSNFINRNFSLCRISNLEIKEK